MLKLFRSKKLRSFLLTAALLCSAAALIAAPSEAAAGAKDGLLLCFNVIVPSLFPFFILSTLVVDLGLAAQLGRAMEKIMRPLFRVDGSCAAAVVLGFIGGYPVGARTALQLYQQGQCSKTEAERLLAFCNNSGPAFILGVVGAGIFGDGRVGFLLYLTHALASLMVGLLFRFHGKETGGRAVRHTKPIETLTLPAAFTGAVTGALGNTLNICAFVIFFSVVLRLLTAYGLLTALAGFLTVAGFQQEWAYRLVAGILELSSGVSSLSGGGKFVSLASMAAFMLGWAGLSVHCQVLTFLVDSGLSARTYLAGKLCHGLFAAALTWLLARFVPMDEPVIYYLAAQADTLARLDFSSTLTASVGIALVIGLLLSLFCLPHFKKRGGKTPHHHVY